MYPDTFLTSALTSVCGMLFSFPSLTLICLVPFILLSSALKSVPSAPSKPFMAFTKLCHSLEAFHKSSYGSSLPSRRTLEDGLDCLLKHDFFSTTFNRKCIVLNMILVRLSFTLSCFGGSGNRQIFFKLSILTLLINPG